MLNGSMNRTIKLRCPSAPATKTLELVAPENQKLDLGFISAAFGLDPNSVKLNGHWISRGLDLVASSVTWRSLLSFFSARGFSTGATASDAIVVHGKPAKLGPKRKHETPGASNFNGNSELQNADSVSKKRLKDSSEGLVNKIAQLSLKRKFLSVDLNVAQKRSRTDEANTSTPLLGVDRHKNSLNGRFPCSFLGVNGKRTRDGDRVVVAAASSKRLG